MPISSAQVQYRDGYEYGMGVVAATGMRANLAAQGAVSGFEGAEGGIGTLKLVRIETTTDLEDSLNISAEASGGIGCFSASARLDFAKSCQVHSHSINLMVVQKLQFGFQQIDNPVLTGTASEYLGRSDVFQQRYGELFCAGFATGGLFYGVLQITYQSEKSKQEVEAAMSGSYGMAFSADVAMKLKQALEKTQSSVEVFLHREGGTLGEHSKPQTPEQLLQTHSTWYNSLVGPDGKGTDLRRPYEALLLPLTVCEGPMPPNQADLDNQRDVLMHCATMRSQTYDKMNLVMHMLAKQDLYNWDQPGTIAVSELNVIRTALAADLQQITRAASKAINSPTDARYPENLPTDGSYKFTVLPGDTLPKPRGATTTTVPDLSNVNNLEAIKTLLAQARLAPQIVHGPNSPNGFTVQQQLPPAGTTVPTDSLVTVIVQFPTLAESDLAKKIAKLRVGVGDNVLMGGLMRGHNK